MKYESTILKRLIDTYGVVGNPCYISEIIKEFIMRGKELYPQLFTYQADWLAHIDEFGLNPSYTVRYTGQSIYAPNTLESPVKSAILKGKTLVNLHKLENYSSFGVLLDEGWKQHFGNNDSYATWRMFDISMLKPNTDYGVFCWVSENTLSETYWECHVHHSSDTVFNAISGLRFNAGETGMRFGKLTTISDFTGKTCGLRHLININTPSTEYVKFRCVLMEYQEGMENWDIPYFEGMQSVKMPVLTTVGKNKWKTDSLNPIFDVGLLNVETNDCTVKMTNIGNTWRGITIDTPLKGEGVISFNVNISLINDNTKLIRVSADGVQLGRLDATSGRVNIKIPQGAKTISLKVLSPAHTNVDFEIYDIQLEEGSVATSYEPYKSNILLCNEDVTLRGIGEIKDTLDCLTGELTERIGEITFDGVSTHLYDSQVGGSEALTYRVMTDMIVKEDEKAQCLVDTFPSNVGNHAGDGIEGVRIIGNRIYLYIYKSRLSQPSQSGVMEYLRSNPMKVLYPMSQEVVKTVDLTILDQNGQSVDHLKSFNGGTHVYTSSLEGSLVPSVDISVVTNLEETLKICSLEGNTI